MMSRSKEVQELAEAAYCFIAEKVLTDLGWSDFEAMFRDYSDRRQNQLPMVYIDVLPLLVHQAVGRDPREALPLAAAWIQFLLSGRILDDVLDDEGIGQPWRRQDLKETLAAGLFAVGGANVALAQLPDREAALDITEAFNKTLALATRAEAQSASKKGLTVESYFEVAFAKTGMVFATGVWAAARLAIQDAADLRLQALYEFGLYMGVMVQIVDDCTDLAIDVAKGQWTLPVLHGLAQKDHPLYDSLVELLNQEDVAGKSAVTVAEILEEMGSLEWSLQSAALYQEQAVMALTDIAGIDSTLLMNYVTEKIC
jgi:geranylgeranyl pyrophosphate synthase